jgi:hypothetical protein
VKFVHALVWTVVSAVCLQAEYAQVKGESRRNVVVTPLTDVVIPTLLAGGEFRSTITLLNLSPYRAEIRLFFADDKGRDTQIPISGVGMTSSLRVTIPAKGAFTVETEYRPDIPFIEVWGVVINDGVSGTVGKIGGFATMNIYDVETLTPFASFVEKKTLMAFDNRNGFESQVAAVNVDSKTAAINFTAYDQNGDLLERGSLDVPAAGRVYLNLNKVNTLTGRRGVVEIETSGSYMGVSGYRMNTETRQWISVPSISLAEWQAR